MRRSRADGSAARRDGARAPGECCTRRCAAEGERRLLWLPVFFGAGIGVYFALTVEPPLWPGIVGDRGRGWAWLRQCGVIR